jgi:GH25 family lysozyme M1 (1,4-beta-N-acetylmuramidase)
MKNFIQFGPFGGVVTSLDREMIPDNAAGIEGVILRCIRENGEVDGDYASYRDRAQSVGLCVWAYCFGSSRDGAEQAQNLLTHCGSGVAVMFDWETAGVGTEVAEAFVNAILAKTGKLTLLYGSAAFLREKGVSTDSVLARCPLMLAEYGPEAHVPAPWPDWSIWQYTDRRSTPGVGVSDGDLFHRPAGNLCQWHEGFVVQG